ncbi:hypothetical protein Kpol_2000p61 [Vanderwaltozyma polyspora DSM 70294]|uniref:Vacuolar protein sorting-associated protein IST1 n=1 Tax=Vanderwaltozyma polyspora (strain ATCC 22028 / DSM 70294 / BCRC 21397 / CBS 2163 / NBRC 10782 / NRRL Y-8283 / UCD 57-17) TaxID=436907 RepID=A7TF69_VANPO|nr:uncharacterized protein Kpol_2000p61 [Vanderwaltozyma polyspora DSM 70294]EDO19094.1 hypothetical protein Kpol_2000p61 [Vanderwaltozyma polyspora DSM 70294]
MPPQVSYNVKLKTCLKMCIQRFRYAEEKQQALAKQGRRDVAQLLVNGKEHKAHYRVESLINDDIHIELLEILELYCELLHARVMIVNGIENEAQMIEKHIEDGIDEAIRSLVYSTLHVPEVKELSQLRDLIAMKFGPDFIKIIIDDHLGVPEKVVKKCSPKLPTEDLVELYLREIANTYEIPYKTLEESVIDEKAALDEGDEISNDSNDKPIVAGENDEETLVNDESHPITIRKPRTNSETVKQDFKIPDEMKKDVKLIHSTAPIKKNTEEDKFEELKKRFAALKR